jgi:hypothetical protein
VAGAAKLKRANLCAFSLQRIALTAVSQRDDVLGVNQDTHVAKDDQGRSGLLAADALPDAGANVVATPPDRAGTPEIPRAPLTF